MSALHETVLTIRAARDQLSGLSRRAGKDSRFAQLVARSDAASAALTEVERRLVAVDVKSTEGTLRFPVQLNEQLESLREALEGADAAPVPAMREVFASYDEALQAQVARWRQMRGRDLEAINEEARKVDLPAVLLPREPGGPAAASGR
jgi:hypothetical protein